MVKDAPKYEVTAVRMGTRQADRSHVFLNYHLYGLEDGSIDVDYFFWVIRSDTAVIVVDTGFSEAAGAARHRTTLIRPEEALEKLGVDPGAVTDLILTHGHYDHIGNVDLFPRARIHMAASEYGFWTSDMARRLQFSYYAEDVEIEVLRDAHVDGRLRLFSDTCEPADGVRVSLMGGHTPGQAVVYVPTTNGTVLLASDALHFYEELERDIPFCAVADLPAMYAAFDRIRLERDVEYTMLVAGHDRRVLEMFPPSPQLPEGLGVEIRAYSPS